ncbi:MAG: YhjD/YihY/BrkB family envelope integrity protein, partial [Candidatus Nanohaloarchaea archaeon]|nr:YhjD/YihY/BrkB family envelope integrity protein [Candidatus Nanohaloarchaea archaeon]
MGELRRATERMIEVLRIARENKVDFMASGITYYELFSLVPLTLIAFLGLAALGGESFAAALLSRLTGILPEVGQDIVRDVMSSSAGQTCLIGLV